MGILFLAGVPFEYPSSISISETIISDNLSYFSAAKSGRIISTFTSQKIGDTYISYTGDLDLTATRLGDISVIFSGDIEGTVYTISGQYIGMDEARRYALQSLFSPTAIQSPTRPGTRITPPANPKEDTFKFQLTAPAKYGKRNADRITGLNHLEDKIGVKYSSFDIKRSPSLRIAKNNIQSRRLSGSNIDFVYEAKRGLLYFNENGSRRGWGEGGVLAIFDDRQLIGSENFTFF